MRLPVNRICAFSMLALLGACSSGGGEQKAASLPTPPIGPAADYPMVVGDPFTVDGVTYAPVDRMNYDAVGYVALGTEGGEGVSGAHKTLPLPSYVEVTSLETGRTILVRIERRGPMSNDRLIELSPGAATQLGITAVAKAPIRVRRVNPPEPERVLLRSGQRAPERLAMPKPLLAVLIRKLDPQATSSPAPPPPAITAAEPEPAVTSKARLASVAAIKPVAIATPGPATPASAPATKGTLVVQAGAYSSKSRADTVATAIGGHVERAGSLHRVRMGPFPSQNAAHAALAKAKAAGYTDSRILRAD